MVPIKRFIPFILILLLAVLACTISMGGPAYPEQRIPVSTDAIGEMQNGIQTSVAASIETGEITIIINETQMTSYLAYQLEKQTDPFITDPQVYLRDGQVQVYGTAQQGYFKVTARIILTPRIDEQGRVQLDLTSADFGPLPVPEGLKDAISAIVSEAYTGSLGPVATGLRIESVIIADGYAMMTGAIK